MLPLPPDPEELFLVVLSVMGAPAAILTALAVVFLINSWLTWIGWGLRTALSAKKLASNVRVPPNFSYLARVGIYGSSMTLLFFLQLQIWRSVGSGDVFADRPFVKYLLASFQVSDSSLSQLVFTLGGVVVVLAGVAPNAPLTRTLVFLAGVASWPGAVTAALLSFWGVFLFVAALFGAGVGNQLGIAIYVIAIFAGTGLTCLGLHGTVNDYESEPFQPPTGTLSRSPWG